MHMLTGDQYLTISKTLPEYSGLSTRTLERRAAEGCFSVFKLGGKRVVRKSDFDEWVNTQLQEPPKQDMKSILRSISDRVLSGQGAA